MVLKLAEVQRRLEALKSRNIVMLSAYISTEARAEFLCTKEACLHTWFTTFKEVTGKRKTGCAKCYGHIITPEALATKLADLKSYGIVLMEPFKGTHAKHLFKCEHHKCEWEKIFRNVKNGRGCKLCKTERLSKQRTLKAAVLEKRMVELKSRNILMLTEYNGMNADALFECTLDDHVWISKLSRVHTTGNGCPKCAGKVLTEEDRLRSKAHTILRHRLNQLVYNGRVVTKIYRTDDVLNHVYYDLFPHWAEQYKIFINVNPKPVGDQVWELDHIIPVSLFNPYDVSELKLCWHQNNLQWLTDHDNCSKGNRLKPEYLNDWHYGVIKTLKSLNDK